jgi:hypothetical protein
VKRKSSAIPISPGSKVGPRRESNDRGMSRNSRATSRRRRSRRPDENLGSADGVCAVVSRFGL